MNKIETPLDMVELDRMLAPMTSSEALTPKLESKIHDRLGNQIEPVRPLPSSKFLTLQFAALFLILATGLVALMGMTGFHNLRFGQAAAISILLGIGILVLSVSLAWQMNPVSSQRTSVKIAAACFALGFIAGSAILFPWRGFDRFVTEGVPCAAIGFGVAIPAAILFALLARRGVPMSPGAFGSTIGGLAALLGVTALQFQCPHQHAAHLVFWHGGVLAVSAAAGFLIARIANRAFHT